MNTIRYYKHTEFFIKIWEVTIQFLVDLIWNDPNVTSLISLLFSMLRHAFLPTAAATMDLSFVSVFFSTAAWCSFRAVCHGFLCWLLYNSKVQGSFIKNILFILIKDTVGPQFVCQLNVQISEFVRINKPIDLLQSSIE